MSSVCSSDSARFALVIFDCDGVLVDSEPISNRVLLQKLHEVGLALTLEEVYARFLGRSMQHCLELIGQLLGRAVPADFAEDYQARTTAAFTAELTQVAGITAVLDTLEIPCCVASSGDHSKMRTTLGLVGLLPRFAGRLFSVTEVAHGKPAPDVFLHAAQRCGARPEQCLVIEDALAGVAAGVAAGMTVYGYAARTPAALLRAAGAHRVFIDMAELPQLIELGPRSID
jgi:HAD superfamily hydrolase (TIGR01509 family)